MQALRLGFFTEVYRPVVNGVVASVDALADGLRSKGHQVYCFTPHMPGYTEAEGPVFRMPSLPLPIRTPYRLTLPLVSRRNLNGVVKRLSLVHAHSPFVTGWMGLRYARRYGMPLVYTYHTQLEAYAHYVPFEQNATRFAASALTRAFANQAGAVVVPTAAMAARLREIGVTARIEIVPSGIDVAHFSSGKRDPALRLRLGVEPDDRLLLYVGRLAKEKNVELLFNALAQANDDSLKLVVAGDGPSRNELEQRALECDVGDSVRFLGSVARSDLPNLYASADAFVMPSVTETQGLVLAEAMAAGARLVAADTPQNRDVVGAAGTVVASTAEAFANCFRTVSLQTEPCRPAQRAAHRFSSEVQVNRMQSLYGSLVRTACIA